MEGAGVRRYEEAAGFLPARLRRVAMTLRDEDKEKAEELRLRAGRSMRVVIEGREVPLDVIVTAEELETLCDVASDFSRYAAMETLRQGYLPLRGGFRLGLCGSAVMKEGRVCNLKPISSASLRIARERIGVAREVAPKLFGGGVFCSTLILSPPGGGKTTLLRDLVRSVSNGGEEVPAQRVALVDERGEVAVMYRGRAQMDVGARTDVLDACPKAIAIPMLLRAMAPQVIAVDEITLPEDIHAITLAAGCGVGLLATIHAANAEELRQKPLYRPLLENRIFSRFVRIETRGARRVYRVEAAE